MTTENTPKTPATAILKRPAAPPPPQPPPELVRLRVDVPGEDYRVVWHIAIDTGTTVHELVCEAVKLLRRYYTGQGLPATK